MSSPLSSARNPLIVSSPFAILDTARSIGLSCLLKFCVILAASVLSELNALLTSLTVLAPVFSPASLVSKSFNGVSRPLSISAFVDLNLAISVV